MRIGFPVVLLALSCVGLAACGSDTTAPGGGTPARTYRGTFGSAASGGVITVNVPKTSAAAPAMAAGPSLATGSAAINVIATLQLTGGGTISLTGTLDGVALILSGSNYDFSGTLAGKGIEGTFTDPSGASGTFSVALSSTADPVAVYCGGYTGTDVDGLAESGTFNLMLASDGTGGVVTVEDAPPNTANVFDVRTNTGGQLEVFPASTPSIVIALTTTYTATDVAGNYDTGTGSSGVFAGNTTCP